MTHEHKQATKHICPHCGQIHQEDLKFCPITGQNLTPIPGAICPNCGQPAIPDWSHCPACGNVLSGVPSTPGEKPASITDHDPPKKQIFNMWQFWLVGAIIIVAMGAGTWLILDYFTEKQEIARELLSKTPEVEETSAIPVAGGVSPNTPEESLDEPPLADFTATVSSLLSPADTGTPPPQAPIRTETTEPTLTPTPTEKPTLAPAFDWNTEVLQSAQSVGYFSSMVIDNQDNYHIAYFQDNSDIVWYAHNDSGRWVFDFVVGGVETGFHLSLDLDTKGIPHIGYHMLGIIEKPEIRYIFLTGTDWDLFRVYDSNVARTDISLALGPDDKPHFNYLDGNSFNVKYAHYTSQSGWDIQTVDAANEGCQSFPIDVDEMGNPHLTYQAASGGLMYATLQELNWHRIIVDESPGAGHFSSLTLDALGQPHIGYYDSGQQVLKYAARIDNVWKTSTIDSAGDVGKYPSIAIDTNGHIHISYYDATNTALKYAHGRDGQWDIYTVDNAGRVGMWNSIALDTSDKPHISYFDDSNEDLKLAISLFAIP